jgi:hypothetical protein
MFILMWHDHQVSTSAGISIGGVVDVKNAMFEEFVVSDQNWVPLCIGKLIFIAFIYMPLKVCI